MKKLLHTFAYILGITSIIVSSGGFVYAQSSVSVQFEKTPLFSEISFLPQDSVTRFVKMTNNTESPLGVSVRATNVENEGFGDLVNLKIKQGNTTLFDGTFTEFFDKSSVALSQIPAGQNEEVLFIATFLPTDQNEYQNKTFSFNLQLLFEGGEVINDITTSFGGGGSSNGGGSGGNGLIIGAKKLIISNEIINSINPPELNSVVVTWDTNIPATSQVIYGLESSGPYNLNLSASNYGYPLASLEDTNKITSHSVLISGLIPLQVYSMRVVSKASPPTIGYEYLFSVDKAGKVLAVGNINGTLISQNYPSGGAPSTGSNGGNTSSNSNSFGQINTAGTESIDVGVQNTTDTEDLDSSDDKDQTASAILGLDTFSWKTALWLFGIIILLFLIIIFWRRRKDEEEKKD
ncbi:MAG: fibronectin type III domain-containing protein [Candidatus Paceibacterota bacterium]